MTASSCRVHLDWDNFRHNLRLLKSRGKTLLPIIKADAYGHGVLRASEELTELGIGWAAIGTLEEGCDVRNHGYRGRIVSLLCRTLSPADVRLAREKRIIPLIHSEQGCRGRRRARRKFRNASACGRQGRYRYGPPGLPR